MSRIQTSARIRSLVTELASYGLAIGLLYLALRGVDLRLLGQALRSVNPAWLVPLAVVVYASHWLRAWRWRIMIDSLPNSASHRISTAKLFGALMAGYMTNYVAPRVGELVRTSIASRLSGQRFLSILGTVVAERILDMVSLALALVSVYFLLADRLHVLASQIALPKPRIGLLVAAGILVIAVVVVVILARRSRAGDKVRKLIRSFTEGIQTIVRSPKPHALLLTTIAMWACYLLMAYIPLRMLGMVGEFGLGLRDAWSLMNLGALGVVVPAPGGTGTYHYITQISLTQIWDVPAASAAAYAILTHAIQMLLYAGAGFASLLVLGIGIRSILPTQLLQQSESDQNQRPERPESRQSDR